MDNFGKQVTAEGEVIIAGTRRPDGTYRKERKVRAGYVPPEEMGAFQTRGSMFRAAQAEAGIPGAPPGAPAGAEAEAVPMSKAAKKNAARKKKRQEAAASAAAAAASAADGSGASTDATKAVTAADSESPGVAAAAAAASADPAAAAAKKAKALRKKLRAVEDLKKKQVEGVELNEDQLAKLQTEAALVQQLQALGIVE